MAELITLFCCAGFSVLLATVFAFSTRAAVAFATAFASDNKVSFKHIYIQQIIEYLRI